MNDSPPPAPVFQAPPPDPGLQALQQQTENQNIDAMKSQTAMDTAHLMRQYGIVNALAGSGTPMNLSSALPANAGAAAMPMITLGGA